MVSRIKKCGHLLAYPLARIFSFSLNSGVFPDKWKTSFVLPIFKKGQRESIKNYRLICPISAIPRLFKDILYTRLLNFVSNKISDNQHGFIPGKSITTNLIQLSNQVTCSLETGSQVDAIYLDLAKAFDFVDHQMLLNKLNLFDFNESSINWFQSYLKDRTQSVRLNGYISEPFVVTSGVAQGSKLGPILFAIFINDLFKVIRYSKLDLFADDCRLSNIIMKPQDAINLQLDINSMVE